MTVSTATLLTALAACALTAAPVVAALNAPQPAAKGRQTVPVDCFSDGQRACNANLDVWDGVTEGTSLLQKPAAVLEKVKASAQPHLISLRRESVPIYRKGKVAAFKTSYSGIVNVGTPPQEFRVVFDTGSAHVVLPAAECQSESCLVHRRYNMSASLTALPINTDGSVVPEGELCDQVTIGFGTGQITGEFVRDTVCFNLTGGGQDGSAPLCVDMHVVLAVEMSTQPFKSFLFDGILGLSLEGLALNTNFSAFDMLIGSGNLGASHFGVFLTEGEDGEENEIAVGGHNSQRLLEPLTWAPVVMGEMGYWQVEIIAVRVNGVTMDFCKDGTCRGVVDTGTSHLGVPAPFDGEVADLLTVSSGDLLDCRLASAPEVEIEIRGYNISLFPFNYMRRLPLREGVTVGSSQGVYVPSNETNATLGAKSSADAVTAAGLAQNNATANGTLRHGSAAQGANQSGAGALAAAAPGAPEEIRRFCRPRLMPVRLPAPLGPKLFILGEPVLHRYYTVFDWEAQQVGFGLANNRWNTRDPSEAVEATGALPQEVDMLLMQTTKKRPTRGAPARRAPAQPEEEVEEAATSLVQVRMKLAPRRQPRRANLLQAAQHAGAAPLDAENAGAMGEPSRGPRRGLAFGGVLW